MGGSCGCAPLKYEQGSRHATVVLFAPMLHTTVLPRCQCTRCVGLPHHQHQTFVSKHQLASLLLAVDCPVGTYNDVTTGVSACSESLG